MTTKNISIIRPLSYWGQVFSWAILFSFVLVGPVAAEEGVLFESSWNTATGTSDAAIDDGGAWDYQTANVINEPSVSAGGPGGNNFLKMVSVGGGGWGNPHYVKWYSEEGDVFGDPDNLYYRVYFRMSQSGAADVHTYTHWFTGANATHTDSKHLLIFSASSDEFPQLDSAFIIGVENYGDGQFVAEIEMEAERWYRYEIHVQKINDDDERWYVRLDGVDITGNLFCSSGPDNVYGHWLNDLYDEGWAFTNEYHANIHVETYDQETINDGWDVAAIEVRDDRWPGPVGPPVDDTTPPTGSMEITGVEDRADRTGTPAVTLALNANDAGSGMGSGAQMQFSNDGVAWSSPEAYMQSKAWTLLDTAPGTEQTRTVHVKFKDVAGNWSNPISDSIILDRQPPHAPLW